MGVGERLFKYIYDIKNTEEAQDTLNRLNPVKFNYKVNKEEKHVGFIAEDVPELVAAPDRKGMSSMDIVAVPTPALLTQSGKGEQYTVLTPYRIVMKKI